MLGSSSGACLRSSSPNTRVRQTPLAKGNPAALPSFSRGAYRLGRQSNWPLTLQGNGAWGLQVHEAVCQHFGLSQAALPGLRLHIGLQQHALSRKMATWCGQDVPICSRFNQLAHAGARFRHADAQRPPGHQPFSQVACIATSGPIEHGTGSRGQRRQNI